VRRVDNGKHLIVRINDRGPFIKGRIVDLSVHAARELGMIGRGLAFVKVEVIAD
jgi:rare lipoprotein A